MRLIVRGLSTLIIIFLVYKTYQRLFWQKQCTACGQMIAREAAICHHCNTIQNDVKLVQAKAETVRAVLRSREGQNGRDSQARVLLVGAIVLIVLGVAVAIWFMQSL